jgi:hypothetical protein
LSAFGASAYYIYAWFILLALAQFLSNLTRARFWLCGTKYRSDVWRFARDFSGFSKDYKFMKTAASLVYFNGEIFAMRLLTLRF